MCIWSPVPASFLLLFLSPSATPASLCSPSSDYVVIGLFYEPCDAVLSNSYTIHNCTPLLLPGRSSAIARKSSLAIRCCSKQTSTPRTTLARSYYISLIHLKFLIFTNLHSFREVPRHNDSSSLLSGTHHTTLPALLQHTNSSGSSASLTRERSTRSNHKNPSPQGSSAHRSQSIDDGENSSRTDLPQTRQRQRARDDEVDPAREEDEDDIEDDEEEEVTRCLCGQRGLSRSTPLSSRSSRSQHCQA